MYADRLALGDSAESIRVAIASAIIEFTASTRGRFVVILAKGASARARIHGEIAHV